MRSGVFVTNERGGAMRNVASSILVLTFAIGAACVAILSATAVRAQSPTTNLLGVYEQSTLNTCLIAGRQEKCSSVPAGSGEAIAARIEPKPVPRQPGPR